MDIHEIGKRVMKRLKKMTKIMLRLKLKVLYRQQIANQCGAWLSHVLWQNLQLSWKLNFLAG